ncbi:MAG TPA: hypothetical protein PLD25_28255 [Chloroflexota bacterium]|nr:hypothetical protein [Chloroflexota bacterium]HUM68040.1 hypothetical protein [Chloroflexota bacterium]
MTYTVIFPEMQHPILVKLRRFQESKEVTWLYGCYCSGKTSLIRQIFGTDLTFNYPTESVRSMGGNINQQTHNNRFSYSLYIQGIPQLADFLDEYISWTDDRQQLNTSAVQGGDLCNSLNIDAFVTNLIAYHETETGNMLGSITWLVQVNVFEGVDREFIDFLSRIHQVLVLRNGRTCVPNLIFESWFPDGFGQNFARFNLNRVPTRRPNMADRQGLGPVRNRHNIKQVVRLNATTETTTAVNEVYEQALNNYLSTTWGNLGNDPNTLRVTCEIVKEWAGLHFGSIKFILEAFEEEEIFASPNVTTKQLETMLENYIEDHNGDFENLMETTSLSLGIGGFNSQGLVQGAWDKSAIYRKRRDLWQVGINIAENEQDIRLIKIVEIYRNNHLDEPLAFPLETDISNQFSAALHELADWLHNAPPDNKPHFTNELYNFVSSDSIPNYNENNQEILITGLINYLNAREHVLPEHLFGKFYQPFVKNDLDEYTRLQSGEMGQYRICDKVVSNAVVKIRLVELIKRVRAYRSEITQ